MYVHIHEYIDIEYESNGVFVCVILTLYLCLHIFFGVAATLLCRIIVGGLAIAKLKVCFSCASVRLYIYVYVHMTIYTYINVYTYIYIYTYI